MAASLASLGNISGMEKLQYKSQELYGRALRSINNALRNPEEAKEDSVLTSILVLQKYETINGIMKIGSSTDPHERGLAMLMKLRGPEQLATETGRSLFRIVQSKMQISELDGSPSKVTRADIDLKNMSADSFGLNLYRLLQGTAQACGALRYWITQLPKEPEDVTELREAVQGATALYTQMIEWQNSLPEEWRYKERPVSTKADQVPFPSKVYLFGDINYGAIWIGFWRSRIHLFQNIVEALGHLPDAEETLKLSHKDLHSGLVATVDDLCASVPYLLCEVDKRGLSKTKTEHQDGKILGAFLLLLGLDAAMAVDDLPRVERRYVLDRLYYIGHSKGIRMALRSRNEWIQSHKEKLAELGLKSID
ncbi:MAG: hypothetical protein Q9227_007928 [Pyrenula ochraceoflavens]